MNQVLNIYNGTFKEFIQNKIIIKSQTFNITDLVDIFLCPFKYSISYYMYIKYLLCNRNISLHTVSWKNIQLCICSIDI